MTLFQTNDRILFQGDSITDAGRCTTPDNLGAGYVALLRGFFQVRHPNLHLEVMNYGVGGNRTTELLERWKVDCEDLKPQVLSLMIGVNDVWRLRGMWNGQVYVTLDEYKKQYRMLLDRALSAGVRQLILMSPTTIAEDNDLELARLLDERTECVKKFASEYGAIYVPTREKQQVAMREAPETRWTADGCHPTAAGHALIAATWLEAVSL